MKLRKTIKGDIGYLKVNWTNTAQTSLYWTTGNNNDYINEDMYGKLKYIPLNFICHFKYKSLQTQLPLLSLFPVSHQFHLTSPPQLPCV